MNLSLSNESTIYQSYSYPGFSVLMFTLVLLNVSCAGTKKYAGDLEPPSISRGNELGSEGYRAGIGDSIEIFVLEDDSFHGTYVVRPSGDIIFPKAGRINVNNLTLDQLEKKVSAVLQTTQLTKATVIADPIGRGSGDDETLLAGVTIYLSGSIVKTGRVVIPFVGNTRVTAYQAIVESGGFASFANKKRSYILRRDSSSGKAQQIPVNFEKIAKGEELDPLLKEGDTIVVPQKMFGL